jgi:glucokinase
MQNKFAIGVDIGGSHISCAAVNLMTGEILKSTFSENNVDNQEEADVIIENWGRTIQRTISQIEINNLEGIGLAMPGPFDYVNGISLMDGQTRKYEKTFQVNIGESLRNYLNLPLGFPVRFINDAAAFAIGEAWLGKGAPFRRSLALTIGTGLGSGFIEDGVPVFSGDRVPSDGFVWHLPYKDSVADDYFSSRGIIRQYFELTGKKIQGVKELVGDHSVEPAVMILFHHFGLNLATLLAPWIRKFEAEGLVVGGNISNVLHLFKEGLEQGFFENKLHIRVEESMLKDIAAIAGSARLIKEDFWPKALEAMNSQTV